MIKLDLKDRKILYELDNDSRQSFAKISKKVGMSKDVVQYRVNKLIENGIITSFYTRINSFRLGYFTIRFYLIFQNTTPDIKNEIIEYYAKNKSTLHCALIEGRFDLVVNVWVKDLQDFYIFWEEGLKKYRKYIAKEIFTIYIESNQFRNSYILPENYNKSDRENIIKMGVGDKKVETDDLDWKILQILNNNARTPAKEIAKKINTTATMVSYRIKKLQQLDVIQGFKIDLNLEKLGYQQFKVDIYLNDYTIKYQIFNYIKYNPHLTWASKSIGVSDLELEFNVENLEKLHQIIQDVIIRFPDAVRSYQYFYTMQLPDSIYVHMAEK